MDLTKETNLTVTLVPPPPVYPTSCSAAPSPSALNLFSEVVLSLLL